MSNKFDIEEKSIIDFSNHLNVPSYQRPYCWGKEEIEKILNDFNDNKKEHIYFIGNIISIKIKDKNEDKFDLIDGQQRITTLWILCLYLYYKNKNEGFLKFCKEDEKPRLNFAIRDNTNEYLKELLKLVSSNLIDENFWNIQQFLPNQDDEKSKSDPTFSQNLNIANAFKIIDNWFFDIGDNTEVFSDEFLINKVKFKFLTAPEDTEENNLFIQINTNGSQFQHYDILKAEFLNKLNEEDKEEYEKKWNWCSETFYSKYISTTKSDAKDIKNKENVCTDIFSIIDEAEKEVYYGDIDDEKNNSRDEFQYIIDFNTLLLHTLFIFCKKNKDTFSIPESFSSEHLLKIFKELREKLSKEIALEFIDTLLEAKNNMINFFIFQDFNKRGFNLIPEAKKENKDETEVYAEQESKDRAVLAQFQRMLYHSSNSNNHYWLGIFLDQYINNEQTVSIELLEKLENIISRVGTTIETYRSYFVDSNEFLKKDYSFTYKDDFFMFKKFPRYWFYKLEYILWKQIPEFKDFIIVSRTSVEHILPQRNRDGVDYEYNDINIHDFGNLVLITVSENSSFSNQNILEKWNYRAKLSNSPLKMNLFFNDLEKENLIKENLSVDDLKKVKIVLENHKKEMFIVLKNYYS